MIRRPLLCLLALGLGAATTNAQLLSKLDDSAPFDCKVSLANSVSFDLTSLNHETTVMRTRDTPPTKVLETVRFNLCADLKKLESVPDIDQCAAGTRVCMTQSNQKVDQTDRVMSVIPIAVSSKLTPEFTVIPSKGLTVILHGGIYPHPHSDQSPTQYLNLTLFCDKSETEPHFVSYDGSQMHIQWSSPAGCSSEGEPGNGGGGGGGGGGDHHEDEKIPEEDEHVGSGIGWFFLVLFLAFVAYFGLGAYYNYSTYGASGIDLIPHRDFWQEVPYMLRDVVSHLCSSVRRRNVSTRGGYMSV